MKRNPSKKTEQSKACGESLFTLEVSLIGGPVTEEFVRQNPLVSRTIQIRGSQTLEDLHNAIFDAFDRDDEHLYAYEFGKRPLERNAKKYVTKYELEGPFADEVDHEGLVHDTTIGALDLKPRQAFFYWFDFGDDWWHKIKVVSIEEGASEGKYPRVTKKVGDSPPQYPHWDEEDPDEEDEEDEDEEDEEDDDEEEEEEEEDEGEK